MIQQLKLLALPRYMRHPARFDEGSVPHEFPDAQAYYRHTNFEPCENVSDHTHTQYVVLFVDYLLSICVHKHLLLYYILLTVHNHSQALYQIGP